MFGLCSKKNGQPPSEANNAAEEAVVTSLAHSPASHLEMYLAYYVSREKPGYAILITGEWGTGKTHQIRRALPDDRAHYVSLFGLTKIEDIEAQVFAKMFPTRASLSRLAERIDSVNIQLPVAGSLGSGGLASALATSFIKTEINNTRPLIFDDLERCSVESRAVLGLINRYVEHHKCRVIVIAHDDKILQEINESKEKIFGQSILVEPNIDAAFAEFWLSVADEDIKDKLRSMADEALATFKESQTASLRVLRHVVEDVVRLLRVLEDRHLENHSAMVEMVRLFSAFAIETRSSRLGSKDLENRREAVYGYGARAARQSSDQPAPPPFVAAASRYKSIDLASSLLNDAVLIEMLIMGRFDTDHIRASLNSSHYFIEKNDAPPWQIVYNFDKLADADVDCALEKMEQQFARREITDSGEFLHIVALKLMMASQGLTEKNVLDIVNSAKIYLNDLINDGRLLPRPPGWNWQHSFDGSYAGMGYWVNDDYKSDFSEVFEYLISARSTVLENKIPGLVPLLLDVVREDGQKFFEKVCHTRNGVVEYEDIPILAHIPPNEFVDAWLDSPRSSWYWIGVALKERKKATRQYPTLETEAAWFPQVAKEMQKRAEEKTGLARLRIIRAVERMGMRPQALQEAEPTAQSVSEAAQEE